MMTEKREGGQLAMWEIMCACCLARFKYIHMEEMLGNVPGARQIFERWMAFEPDHHGWMAYIKVRWPLLLSARA